jgi:hypothetical protein
MTIRNLLDHQINALVQHALRLDQSQGTDITALTYVRNTVAHELLTKDNLEITAAALGQLTSESAVQCLQSMVNHCHDHYYLEDRVLSALVVPVTVRLQALKRAPFSMTSGDTSELRELAARLSHSLHASMVGFDSRFYGAASLYALPAKKLRDILLQLERGVLYPKGGPQPVKLHSSVEPQWHLVHFLGVEVTRLQQQRRLNDPAIQERIRPWLQHGAFAVDACDDIFLDRGLDATAQCDGVWYLNHGLKKGADCLRRQRLHAWVDDLAKGIGGIRMYYLVEPSLTLVRLMVVSQLMTVEFKWPLNADETVQDFLAALSAVASDLIPASDVLELTPLDAVAYVQLAHAQGLPFPAKP